VAEQHDAKPRRASSAPAHSRWLAATHDDVIEVHAVQPKAARFPGGAPRIRTLAILDATRRSAIARTTAGTAGALGEDAGAQRFLVVVLVHRHRRLRAMIGPVSTPCRRSARSR
jgi:hypothetical protein